MKQTPGHEIPQQSRDSEPQTPRRIPILPRRIFEFLLHQDDRDPIIGDIEEFLRDDIIPGHSWIRSTLWYWRQVLFSLNSFMVLRLRRCLMLKPLLNCFNTMLRAVLGYYVVVLLFTLSMNIAYVVSGLARITGVRLWPDGLVSLQLAFKPGSSSEPPFIMLYWNYIGPLLLAAIALLIAQSSKIWAQFSAAYLALYAGNFLTRFLVLSLLTQPDITSRTTIRIAFPLGRVWSWLLLLQIILCSLSFITIFLIFRILARTAASSLLERLRTFAIRFAFPIFMFWALTFGSDFSKYSDFELNLISFSLVLSVALIALLISKHTMNPLPST